MPEEQSLKHFREPPWIGLQINQTLKQGHTASRQATRVCNKRQGSDEQCTIYGGYNAVANYVPDAANRREQ